MNNWCFLTHTNGLRNNYTLERTKQHAAIVLAARNRELGPNTPLSSDDPALAEVLLSHVKAVFADYDGKVGMDAESRGSLQRTQNNR